MVFRTQARLQIGYATNPVFNLVMQRLPIVTSSIKPGSTEKLATFIDLSFYLLKTGLLKRSQKYKLAMLRLFLVIFFANYIKIFHKTEVLTVIQRCITCLNLNWIKSYDIKHIFIHFRGFSILEEKKYENLPLINGHFTTISGHSAGAQQHQQKKKHQPIETQREASVKHYTFKDSFC